MVAANAVEAQEQTVAEVHLAVAEVVLLNHGNEGQSLSARGHPNSQALSFLRCQRLELAGQCVSSQSFDVLHGPSAMVMVSEEAANWRLACCYWIQPDSWVFVLFRAWPKTGGFLEWHFLHLLLLERCHLQ